MHPVLFQIHGFVVGTYGVAIVVGMLCGLALISHLARRRGMDPEFFFDLTFVLLISGLLGARLLYIITVWDQFLKDPMAILLSRQGFVFQGGFVAALAAGLWFARRRHMALFESADVVAPALALAHGFGRIGCFFAGCCYGLPIKPGTGNWLENLLAVQFPLVTGPGSDMFNFAFISQAQHGLIPLDAKAPLPVLPTELFEMAGNFAICLILLWAWKRRRFSGQIFALYILIYSILRFGLEFIRGDVERGVYHYFGGTISTAQIICIFTAATALIIWFARRGKGIAPLPAPVEDESTPPEPPPSEHPAVARKTRPASRRT